MEPGRVAVGAAPRRGLGSGGGAPRETQRVFGGMRSLTKEFYLRHKSLQQSTIFLRGLCSSLHDHALWMLPSLGCQESVQQARAASHQKEHKLLGQIKA